MANRIRGRYVAGMWEKYLASQLTWRVKTAYENGRLLYPSRRPKAYRAPTFSWASVDAPQGVQFGETKREKELHISVRDFESHTLTESPFGPLKKPKDPNDTSDVCYIDIDCYMDPVKIELHDFKGNPRYHCKFWREPKPATQNVQQSEPRLSNGHAQHTDPVGQVNGSANADETGKDTNLEQESMPHEVHNGDAEQAQVGAEREEPSVDTASNQTNGTAVSEERRTHSTRPPTSRPLQPRQLEAKSTVGVYLDCPEDDGEELASPDAESFCVPLSTNSGGDLICLLIQRQNDALEASSKELYRCVGLLTFPAFLPIDQKEILEQARKHQAQIRLI